MNTPTATPTPVDPTADPNSRSRRLTRIGLLAIAGGALLLGACGGTDETDSAVSTPTTTSADGGDGESVATGTTVEIERSRYAPLELQVGVGETVDFVNLDAVDHTVTSADGSSLEYDSGAFGQDETFSQTYDEAGSFSYFCKIHPTMRATIIVE